MPILSSGSNITLTVSAGQILTVQSDQAIFDFENPIGTRVGEYGADSVFGPFTSAGSVKLTSVQGPVYYELGTGQSASTPFIPANVAITGGTIGTSVAIGGAPVSGAVPVVSGSVRTHIPTVTATASGSLAFVFRSADYSVVQCDNPVVELWNGYCIGNGTHTAAAETPTGAALQVRYAMLTGGPGTTAANQTGATVWPATFYGMLSDAEFKAAGGTVSSDGTTITVPDGLRFRTDPIPGVRLSPLTRYYHQLEEVYQTGQLRVSGDNGSTTFGDMRWNQTANTSSPVYSADWSISYGGTTPSTITGSTKMPLAVFGSGDGAPRSRLVGIEGDSINTNGANAYIGSYGERSAIKTALINAGYSFVTAASSGSNMGDMKTYGGWRVRMGLLKNAYAVITDHGHNDRGTSTGAFSTVLPLFQWHTGMIRAFAKPGAKVIRSTLAPHTSSTDTWLTLANQSYQTAADNPTTGWVGGYLDYLRRTGAYAGVAFSGIQDPDGYWDLLSDLGAGADIKWPVDGVTANYGTVDGTHPSAVLCAKAAAALTPKLPTLLGF